ncbi:MULTISPECIES: hypothetical protein [Streptomyces]
MKELEAAAREMGSGRVPQETVGPAAAYAAKVNSPSVTSSQVGKAGQGFAVGASYPDPVRAMSLDECKSKMVDGVVYLKSRFAVCTAVKVNMVWLKKRGPVGFSSFSMYLRGSVPARDRMIVFDYDFADFVRKDTTETVGQMETFKYDMPRVEPAGAKVITGGNMPQMPMSFDQLAGMGGAYFRHTLTVPPRAGEGT